MSSSASAIVRVEKATSDLLIEPDWTMNMDICDLINTEPGEAKDVVKAVKKRLQHKNPVVQFLALTLLETIIKNCGEYVHFQVVDRDILQEMIKIVRKKTDMQVRDKILVLLGSWQEAFGGPEGKYPQYYLAYTELKQSGVEFPRHSPDSALIFTPTVTHPTTPLRCPQIGYEMPSNSSLRLDKAMASEMANLSLSDLDKYHSVMELLSDMLKAVNPTDPEAVKDEVIVDLVSQCCSNQKKLMELVNSTGDEELLGQGLALNDDLQSLLDKHDAIASGSPLPAEPSESIPEPKAPVAPIDTPAASNQFEDEEEEEEDDFAQLARRNSRYKPATQATSERDAQVVSPNHTDTGSTSEPSYCGGSNALALPDPPASVGTSNKEQDMIDLLSATWSSYPSVPHTPAPPFASFHNRSSGPGSPCSPLQLYTTQQPYMVNQGYIPYNNYVAPWVQPQPQPQPQAQPRMQPQPQLQPWPHFQPQPQPQPQLQPQPQMQPQPQPQLQPRPHFQPQPQPQAQPQMQPQPQTQLQAYPHFQPQPQPQPQLQVEQIPSSYVPPPWEDTSSANPNPFVASTDQFPASTVNTSASQVPTYATQPQHQYNSSGPRAYNVPAAAPLDNANNGQTGYGSSPKPNVNPSELFEGPIDMKNTDRTDKSSTSPTSSGSPGQGMIGGRK